MIFSPYHLLASTKLFGVGHLSEVLKEHQSNTETKEPEPPKKKINLLLVSSDLNDERERASVRTALDYY
ncbi:hypothetical protein UY3_15798 [Chelonia mydas]|uniref:Uncharacterized protein n=1 Tax=Chelonia mydas TaxID=8469 RepID=M7B4N8_CHEMY|nr:hypothetical protein UY3_15798 [Chelonia mydas]